jgi:hypothetical protein
MPMFEPTDLELLSRVYQRACDHLVEEQGFCSSRQNDRIARAVIEGFLTSHVTEEDLASYVDGVTDLKLDS